MQVTIYKTIDILLAVIEYAILARVIISWLPVPRNNRLILLLYQVTDPILVPVRNIISKSAFGKNMMFDFSPVVAFILIGIVRNLLMKFLFTL